LKSDSYAVESNIHFPTDISLLWDSGRKCLDTIKHAEEKIGLQGWRKLKCWRKKLKNNYRTTANIHQKKGHGYKERLSRSAQKYLDISIELNHRVLKSLEELKSCTDILAIIFEQELRYYQKMLSKHIDLVERRIIKGEKIPHKEKIFSIFEPHVEWIQKGKANNKVELGHNTLITTDQYHFIVDHKVMVGESDSEQPLELINRLEQRFEQGYKLGSISFDRGFHSKLAKLALEKKVEKLIMPSKGKRTADQIKEEKDDKMFKAFRNKHSAVESNINELEHAGVNKVPDKGLRGFKKYVAMGVLAYNIRRLGRIVIAQNLINTELDLKKLKKAA
jgi:IS5 family transposase